MQVSKIQNQELLCQRYWKRILSNTKGEVDKLSKSFYIHEINQYLIGGYIPMKKIESVGSIIAATDKDFKCYKRTDKELTLWRGIDGAEIFQNPYMKMLIEMCKKLKSGDILRMREYAFASDEQIYAENYTQDDGILYEIIVPKGARIADDWNYIFPRESLFLCTQNDLIKKNNKQFHHIKLTYLKNKSSFDANISDENILHKIKSFILLLFRGSRSGNV